MTAIALANGAGIPVESPQFSLWFLKEKGLITRTDQGDYYITADGAEWLERRSLPQRSGEPAGPRKEVRGDTHPTTRAAPGVERRSIASANEEISPTRASLVETVGAHSA